MLPKIYLAGPIAGNTLVKAYEWRDGFRVIFKGLAEVRNPLRGKEYLEEAGILDGFSYNDHPISSGIGVVTRDRNDVKTADLVIMNVLNAPTVSIGTMVELGWADAYRIPVILMIEKEGNIHDHLFTQQLAGYRVENYTMAAELAFGILNISPKANGMFTRCMSVRHCFES